MEYSVRGPCRSFQQPPIMANMPEECSGEQSQIDGSGKQQKAQQPPASCFQCQAVNSTNWFNKSIGMLKAVQMRSPPQACHMRERKWTNEWCGEPRWLTMRAESLVLCGRFVQLKNKGNRSRTWSRSPCACRTSVVRNELPSLPRV